LAQTVVPRWVGSCTARSRLIAGMRSTKVTSVCQLLALPWVESIGRTAFSLPRTVGCGSVGVPSRTGELVLGRVVEVTLAGEEDDLVRQQGAADLGHGRGRYVAAEFDAADAGADRFGDLRDGDVVVAGVKRRAQLGGTAFGDGHDDSSRGLGLRAPIGDDPVVGRVERRVLEAGGQLVRRWAGTVR